MTKTVQGRRPQVIGALAMIAMLMIAGCQSEPASNPPSSAAPSEVSTPAEFTKGEQLFNANCARCHGEGATGTGQGPPLVHIIYEPNHHADASFHLAVRNGVRPHHWQFGAMLPISGVSEADVSAITSYVRWLQRQAGIS